MATKRRASKASKAKGSSKRVSGGPIIIDGSVKRGRTKLKFPVGEWTCLGNTCTSNHADSIKKLYVRAGAVVFELAVSNYDEIRIKFV